MSDQLTVEQAARPAGWDKPAPGAHSAQLGQGRPSEASRATNRPKRVPIGTRDVLTFARIPGYKTRVVNDVEDRIERFKAAGYEIVKSDEMLGDRACGVSGSIGSEVSKPVGAGRKGVLMKIREDWYAEDQAAKQARITEGEQQLYPNAEAKGLTTRLGRVQLEGIKTDVIKGTGSR